MNVYQLSISDLINNNLAAADQGICGVELSFNHQYIYDVEVILESPAGQAVRLIGPMNNQFRPPTLLTRWFVDFNRCSEPNAPDTGAPGVWNNNFPFNWLAGGLYQGTYHPNQGCLEDFNTGPANGNWTIRINSSRVGARGGIIFFRLIFCDDRGIDCCFADPGRLVVESLERCEGHLDLDIQPNPLYSMPRPSEAEYGYTYLIGRDGLFFGLDSLADLRDEGPGNYTLCGLSYRRDELGNLPPPDGVLSLADIRNNLASFTPYLCAELTQDCYDIRILPRVDTTFLNETICLGDSYQVGSQNFSASGLYHVNLLGQGLCDSVVQLQLAAVSTLRTRLVDTICFGDTYRVGGIEYDQTGIFETPLTAAAGCDSIVTLELVVRDRIATDTVVARCAGDFFQIGTEQFASAGIYNRTLISAVGCDSSITLDLAILAPQLVFADTPVINCYTPVVTLDASPSFTQFGRSLRWFDSQGTLLGTGEQLSVDTAGWYYAELTEDHRGQSCTVRDSLQIVAFQSPPSVDVGANDTLNCIQASALLGGANSSSGSEFSYQWTGPPTAVFLGPTDGRTTTVSSPGIYQLQIINEETGCRDSASVVVRLDTLRPLPTVAGVAVLDCAVTRLRVSADTLQARADELLYNWSGLCLPGAATGSSLSLDCAGTYQLLVRNQTNGCEAVELFTVTQDTASPQPSVLAPDPLTCYEPTQLLDASNSSPTDRIRYRWLDQSGNILGNLPTLLVDSAHIYRLLLEDTLNFCRNSVEVAVLSNQTPPIVEAGPDTSSLTCRNPSLTLGDDSTSQGANFSYAWTLLGAPDDTISTERFLTVEAPGGSYILSVFDQQNGCRRMDSIRVLLDQTPPFIRFAPVEEFGCFAEEVLLDARPTSLLYNYSLSWSGPCLPADSDSTAIAVFCPGDYQLQLTNTDNGCVADSSVTVSLADNAVVAILPDTAFIDCISGLATIDRGLSTPTSRTNWLRDGQVVNLIGTNPIVNVPGTYTMIISNFDGSCMDTASIVVVADCPLLAIIVPPDSLTCARSQVLLDASFSIPAAVDGVTVEWLSDVNPACILPGANDRQLITVCPGDFSFVVSSAGLGIRDTASVTVRQNLVPPVANAGPNDTINCYTPFVTLDAAASEQDSRFSYRWLDITDDTLANQQVTSVNQPGLYFLQVTNEETGCRATDAVTIFRDVAIPSLRMSNQFIPCREDSFQLTVLATPVNRPYAYSWAGPSIQANRDSATLILGGAGVYTATVTNLQNGCPNVRSIIVEQLPCPPCMTLVDTALTCLSNPLPLAIDFCEPCQGCTFSWFRNGAPIPDADGSVLLVTQAGNYRVFAVNQFGLSANAFAQVDDWRVMPSAAAGPDRFLSCDSSSVLLGSVVIDTFYGYQYQWLDALGQALPQDTTTFLRTTAVGDYVLRTFSPLSGCIALDTVVVAFDTLPPIADAGFDTVLDCDNRFRVLDGNNSSVGSNFRFAWSGFGNSACLEGVRTLSPIVICGGDYILTVRNLRNGCISRDTVEVLAADELPLMQPLPDTNFTCRFDTILLSGYLDNPQFESSWCATTALGDTSAGSCSSGTDLTVDSTGVYRFTVTNPLTGCFNDFEVAVGTDFRAPTAFAGASDTLYCTLDSLALNGSATTQTGAGAAFTWSSITGFPVSQADSATAYAFLPDRYALEVTDQQNGCTALDTVTIFRDVEAPIANVAADTNLTCTRRQIRLLGSGQTFSGQIRYRWQTSDGHILLDSFSPMPLINAAGQYQFFVTDPVNNCTTAAAILVAEDTIQPIAQFAFQEDSLLINCYRPSLLLDLSASTAPTGNTLSYRWLFPSLGTDLSNNTSPLANIDRRGRYRLVVRDQGNNCSDTLSMEVLSNFTLPSVQFNEPDLLDCNTPATTILATSTEEDAPYRYAWVLPFSNDTITGATFSASRGGDYQLLVQDTINGCRVARQLQVEEDRALPIIVLNNPNPLGCDRPSALITAAGSSEGSQYLASWRNANNDFTPTNSTYTIRASEAGVFIFQLANRLNGCVARDSVVLERQAQPITSLELEVIPPNCAGDLSGGVMVLGFEGGTPPYRFRLDGGILTDRMTYEDLPIGQHQLTIVDSSGCDRSTIFDIDPAPPILVSLGPDTNIRLGDSLALRFTTNLLRWDTLIWSSQGPIAQPGANPLVVRPSREYIYQLTIRDENGCEGSDFIRVGVDNQLDLFMPNAFSPNGDNNNDRFFPYAGPGVRRIDRFMVFDRWGNMLHDASNFAPNNPAFGWDGTLNGRPLNPQTFIWHLALELPDGSRVVRYGEVVLLR